MANYRTCLNCAHAPNECATRDRVKTAIAGLAVTSIKFRCPDRAPVYRPGDRVGVSWVLPDEDGGWNREATEETWPATVISEIGPKFLICVDDTDSDYETPARSWIKSESLYCKVSAGKLSRLDEPRRNVCGLCGIVSGNSFNGCWQEGGNPDRKCLRVISDTVAKGAGRG